MIRPHTEITEITEKLIKSFSLKSPENSVDSSEAGVRFYLTQSSQRNINLNKNSEPSVNSVRDNRDEREVLSHTELAKITEKLNWIDYFNKNSEPSVNSVRGCRSGRA